MKHNWRLKFEIQNLKHTPQLKQNKIVVNEHIYQKYFFTAREDTDILQRHHLLIYPLGCKFFLGTPA